jgi:DNA invertase Pin-like site-specific DNA recombinase
MRNCVETRPEINASLTPAKQVPGQPVIIGYARVSTQEQNLELQTDELTRAGCERIFTDHISGASSERPGREQAKTVLRNGDTLIVWRLDRLGRSLRYLIGTITELDALPNCQ